MKVELTNRKLVITPDPDEQMEKSYVRQILSRILFAYSDTEVTTWRDGIRITGKGTE